MNKEQPNKARSEEDREGGHSPVFKAVLIYKSFAAGAHARCLFERLTRASGQTLEERMWNFDMLGIWEARNAAVSAARKADLLAVSVSGRRELPSAVRAWFEMWLWLLEDENPTRS